MPRRFARLAAPLLFALTAAAPPGGPPAPAAKEVEVAIKTDQGTITLSLDAEHAPVTTANFLRYVDLRKFDGTTFYRAMHLDWGDQPNGLIQGGIGADPRRALKPIAHEPTDRTGVLHKVGTISMARFAPGTAMGDFSLLLSDMPGLDANPEASDPELKAGFAAFGHVTEGMDVIRKIWDLPRSPTKGAGFLKGQMIEVPVKILSVRRAPVNAKRVPAITP